jgi:DNA-binding protein HU-beta
MQRKSIILVMCIAASILLIRGISFSANKPQVIEELAARTTFTKDESKKVIDALVSIIKEHLKAGDSVSIVGFGSFSVAKSPDRTSTNPQTGAVTVIKGVKTPKFAFHGEVKEYINK